MTPFFALMLVCPAVAASPEDDVVVALARQFSLDQGLDTFGGLVPDSRWKTAYSLGRCAPVPVSATPARKPRGARAATPAQLGHAPNAVPKPPPLTAFPAHLAAALSVECARDPGSWSPRYSLRPVATVSVGDATPDNLSGDTEPGLLSVRAGGRAAVYSGPFVLRATANGGIDAIPDAAPAYSVPELWLGADTGSWWLGAGRQDRWMGPGRGATLLLSNNAIAPWMANGGLDGHLPGAASKIGRFRAEVGVGVLAEPRTDVDEPGIMLMDFRYLPVPEFEICLSRASIFGGEGRPDVDVGQLLIPSEPHVYDDPDQELPDQDELAALSFRVNLPLRKRWRLPIDHVSGWWEYGGEDMVARDFGGVPYPTLAGIANLYGGEIHVRPITFTAEYAKLMDDYFRWYVGHRVYHEGFQQSDRVMGHFGGSDSETVWAQLAFDLPSSRVRAWGDRTRRVFVLETRNERVFALPTEEVRLRVGAAVDLAWKAAWWSAAYTGASTTGRNFVASDDVVEHRFVLGMSLGPELSGARSR